MTTPQEQLADVAKAAPPLTVTGMTIMGFPISDWVLLLTAVYTGLQITLLFRRLVIARRVTDTTCVKDCPSRRLHDNY